MSSHDTSPFSWVHDLDHDIASLNIAETTFESIDPYYVLASMVLEHTTEHADTYHDLATVGRHLIPLDSEGMVVDDAGHYDTYMLALNLALASLNALSERLNIDVDMFHKAWRINGLVTIADNKNRGDGAVSRREQSMQIGQEIMTKGQQIMDKLGPIYDPVLEGAYAHSAIASANPGILRSSYGFILGGGLNALNRILEELIKRDLYDETEIKTMLDKFNIPSNNSGLDRSRNNTEINHIAIAEEIDTEAFYAGMTVEQYLGGILEKALDRDDSSVEILQKLTAVLYPSAYGYMSLDELGEAHLYGAVLAFDIMFKRVPALRSLEDFSVGRTWRKLPIHQHVYKSEDETYVRKDDVESHVYIMLQNTTVHEYESLLTKISDELGHDYDEAAAFANGFTYMMGTGKNAVKACINKNISSKVKTEMENFDDELRRLLEP